MPTLHNVTENTKKILRIGGITVSAIILVILMFRGGVFLKNYFFPTPPPPPTVAFGKLTPLTFPESQSQGLTFTIDTITGDLPVFLNAEKKPLDRVSVYEIFNPEFSLLDLQNAKATVSKIGFFGREVSLGNNIYEWSTNQTGLGRVVKMNIVSKNFTYASPFRQNERVLAATRMPDRLSSVARSKAFLTVMGLFPTDIDETKTRTELLRIEGEELLPVQTLREAQVIRVNFFQKDIDELPLYYDNPPYSSLSFYIATGERFDPDIVQAEYYHQFTTEKSATYPLKSVQKAYEELQEGKGYIAANYVPETTIKIKEVEMGYYVSSGYQEYLVPIYIFKGLSEEFYAYVLAIPDDWFDLKTPTLQSN